MKPYVKITMSKGEPFSLPYEKALQLLSNAQQIVMLTDENGKWSGETINKAHIVCTDIDSEKTSRITDESRLLEDPNSRPMTEEQRAQVGILLEKYKPNFLRK